MSLQAATGYTETTDRRLREIAADKLAVWVSRLAAPPVLIVAGIVLVAGQLRTPATWRWAFFQILFTVGLPLLYVIHQVRSGRVHDLDLSVRQERVRPMIVMLFCAAAGWLILSLGQAPSLLAAMAAAGMGQIAALLPITLRWKISGHCAGAAAFTVVAWVLWGSAAAPLVFSVPLVAWARLHLGRHDLPQTMAGAGVGTLVTLLALQAHISL